MSRLTAALVALATAGVTLASAPAHAATVIQPGVAIHLGGSGCTMNWIYDGTGASNTGTVYGGTARHCTTGVGQAVYLATGNTVGSQSIRIGTIAYVSAALDFSLIAIDAANLPSVSPALKGHPQIPTGVSTATSSALGDVIQFSGYGVGVDLTAATQESRVGVLAFNDGTQHYTDGLVTPGDSGGPVADVTDGNKALGIVDTLGVSAGTPFGASVGEGGVSLPALLADAAANGVPVALRTV
jgi:hypothetical protein